ncbi:hypothetical protein LTR12_006309 [Friedmanniomyces endolithicus]|nr:hypothetical protein LTR12_006309 [Friedmanniomyces endolithicus]
METPAYNQPWVATSPQAVTPVTALIDIYSFPSITLHHQPPDIQPSRHFARIYRSETTSAPHHSTETDASSTLTMKERAVFIPPYDYHAALDEYNERWEAVSTHQTSTPLPSVGLNMFGLQSHAFIDAEGARPPVSSWPRATLLKANAFRFYCKAFGLGMDVVQKDGEVSLKLRAEEAEKAGVVLLFRFLLNKEQHRFGLDSMKWRTEQVGVSNEEISEGMTATAIRAAVQELIVECTGDGVDVRREDVEGIDKMAGEDDGEDSGTVGEQDEEEEEEREEEDAGDDDDMDLASQRIVR